VPRINGQLAVYAAIGAVLLLVGWSSIRDEKGKKVEAASPGPTQGRLAVGAGGRRLVVDVSGAVRRPGVYRFAHGARVIDAIERAGGATPRAALSTLNRAATLSDGQQVMVPASVGDADGGPGGQAGAGAAPISLGTATQEQLEEIDGIGPVTAQKILEFRDSRGGLASIDELDEVSGIGPVTMEALRSALQP